MMRGFLFCVIIYIGEIERKGENGCKLNARSDVTQGARRQGILYLNLGANHRRKNK